MNRIDAFIAWFSGHRTQFGGLCLSIGAVLTLPGGSTTPPSTSPPREPLIALIGTHLMTTGMFKSDDFHRDKLRVIETKVDRRNPESLIPVKDLKKLLAEDDKFVPPSVKGDQERKDDGGL